MHGPSRRQMRPIKRVDVFKVYDGRRLPSKDDRLGGLHCLSLLR